MNEKIGLYLIAGIVLVATCFVRFRLLGVPLERDEGEYAYVGWQLLNGILPYTESSTMKLPGIHFVYAIILAIFGQTHTSIHLALLFVNIATSFLMFLLGRRLLGEPAGILAATSFLVMTLSPSVQGFWANSEHFVIFSAMGGILLMMIALENENKRYLFLSGILLGCAILIKQHAIFYSLFGLTYIVYFKKQARAFIEVFSKAGFFVIGVLTPLILIIIIYFATGNFDEFWFWTFKYAFEYVSLIPLNLGVHNFKVRFAEILNPNLWILLLSLIGIVSVGWSKTIRSKYIFPFGLLIFSFFAITPGLYFRPHYFILLMPSLSLFAGIGASSFFKLSPIQPWFKVAVSLCTVAIVLGAPFFIQKNFLFKMSVSEATRYTYGLNPFPESIEISNYINKNTDEDDDIAILGSEPQIYFYSKRKAATKFIYMYPLTEKHRYARAMQAEMIKEIEHSQPKYILIINVPTSWLWQKESSRLLLSWSSDYLEKRYEISGVVDIFSDKKTIYKLGDPSIENYLNPTRNDYSLRPKTNLFIFKKKHMDST